MKAEHDSRLPTISMSGSEKRDAWEPDIETIRLALGVPKKIMYPADPGDKMMAPSQQNSGE